jgi:hypothetical protein
MKERYKTEGNAAWSYMGIPRIRADRETDRQMDR